jgi:NADH:ubiquinone oxidoreductase subunit 6 (subunit J)
LFKPLACLALAAAVFCLLQLNGRSLTSDDSLPYRYLPTALLRHGTFRLDAFPELAAPGHYAVVRDRAGHLISKKPALPGVIILPPYLAYVTVTGHEPAKATHRMLLGKLGASAVAGLAAAVMMLLVWAAGVRRRWLGPAAALGMVFLTPFWFTAMDCWPHPLLALLNAAALLLLSRSLLPGATPTAPAASRSPALGATPETPSPSEPAPVSQVSGPAGLACWGIGLLQGLAIAARLGAGAVALVFVAAVLLADKPAGWRRRGWRLAWFAAGMAPPLALLGWYNAHYFGSPLAQGFGAQAADRLQAPWVGLAGFIFSPAKGLLFFSPVLLLGCWGLGGGLGRRLEVRFCAAAIAVHLLFWSCYADWFGGWCYGPRYLADVMPFFTLLAVLGLERLLDGGRRPALVRWAVGTLAALSLFIQIVGMFGWDAEFDRQFDRGFRKWQRGWVWQVPPEPAWILARGVWYWPKHIP